MRIEGQIPLQRVALLSMLTVAVSISPPLGVAVYALGDLSQLSGMAGCVGGTTSGDGCSAGVALSGVRNLVVSTDGNHAYAVAPEANAVLAFDRNPLTGALQQKPDSAACISETLVSCTAGRALRGADGIVISHDGRSVYVAASQSSSVAIFDRDLSTGILQQKAVQAGCVGGADGDGCDSGFALQGASALAISPDDKHLYVASNQSNSITLFRRDGESGELSQASECLSDPGRFGCGNGLALVGASSVVVSPDGRNVYVASTESDAVSIFHRQADTGVLTQQLGVNGCIENQPTRAGCTPARGLDRPASLTMSADGSTVYASSTASNAVAVLARNPGTGVLTQVTTDQGCVSSSSAGGCSVVPSLVAPAGVAVSSDGRTLYIASAGNHSITQLERRTGDGTLRSTATTVHCVATSDEGCAVGRGLNGASGVALSPDGRHLYVAASSSNAIAGFERTPILCNLRQEGDESGCVRKDRNGRCTTAAELEGVGAFVVSADGQNAYVTSSANNALIIFDRNRVTGGLTQKPLVAGCISAGNISRCIDAVGLHSPEGIALSPDGRNLYVASRVDNAVLTFDRNPANGVLIQKSGQLGCTSETLSIAQCRRGRALTGATGIAVSPDGTSVYVTARDGDALASFTRNPQTGVLEQISGSSGCLRNSASDASCGTARALGEPIGIVVSPDGANVYVASREGSAVAVFNRAANGRLSQRVASDGCISSGISSLGCRSARALTAASFLAMSPDGLNLYVAGLNSNVVAVLSRNLNNGRLSQASGTAGCIGEQLGDNNCQRASAVQGTRGLDVSRDGSLVAVAAQSSDSLTLLLRDPVTGALAQSDGRPRCLGTPTSCRPSILTSGPVSVAIAPDTTSIYTLNSANDSITNGSCQDSPCVGDCNGNLQLSLDEILNSVDTALSKSGTRSCARPVDSPTAVYLEEVVRSVNLVTDRCYPNLN